MKIRVNGKGNAWPVFLGTEHPMYNRENADDLSNASYSLITYCGDWINSESIQWEVLIDAGNHTVPFLLKNENRIPEAIVLTHGHADHILGVDWVAQSHFFRFKKKYPLYCSPQVWDMASQSVPHLKSVIDFKELLPGVPTYIAEVKDLQVTAFPVFHGEGASGASMLFFEDLNNAFRPAVFTGDMLSPLLRRKDYETISNAAVVYIDTNNRFPYPSSNHQSFTPSIPIHEGRGNPMQDWLQKVKFTYLLAPHIPLKYNNEVHTYFDEFLYDWSNLAELPVSILQFAKLSKIPHFKLIHYSGWYDKEFYNLEVFGKSDLEKWSQMEAIEFGLKITQFSVPEVGEFFNLCPEIHE
jgi:glyoxylase-like metal-dependent hydrolase (beta-lactamase superfamily II)